MGFMYGQMRGKENTAVEIIKVNDTPEYMK